MELRTLVLLTTLVEASYSFDSCPQACKCNKNYNGAVARCTELDPDVQKFSSEIIHLVVENFIGERDMVLSDMAFIDIGLDRIATIKIVNSTLRNIDVNAFHGLNHLEEVDFSHNRLTSIHPDTFQNNKKLERVILKGNPLSVLEQKNHLFLNSASIRELDLSYCRLTQIASRTFSNLKNLEFLDLSGNDLTEIKADTLAELVNLEDLYLADNSISKIHPDAFSDIEDMTKLSLKGNPIKTLEGIEVPGLAELDVSECDLEILAVASFEGFPELNNLNLSRNSIRDIDPETFSSLSNLKFLDLSYNMIRGPLFRHLFQFNKKLETLSFTGNKELKIFREFVGSFPRLYHLDISDCGLFEITENTFHNMSNLATLNMSNNYIEHIKPHLFKSLSHLNVLDLSNNKLHYVNSKLFFNNRKLTKISLAGNFFHHVPAVLFQTTPDLTWLDLSNCRLVTLWNITEAYTMKNARIFSKLNYLNLSGNKLVKLHRHSFISMQSLEKLDISNNPIQCTSDFSHVMQWLIVRHVMPNKGSDRRPVNIGLIDNNVEWDEVLKSVCPIDPSSQSTQSQSINNLQQENPTKTTKQHTLSKNIDKPKFPSPDTIMHGAISNKGPEQITTIEPIDDPPLVLPKWDQVLKAVRPIDDPSSQSTQSQSINNLQQENPSKTTKQHTLRKNIDKLKFPSSDTLMLGAISYKGPEQITTIEPIDDPPLVWPMILIWISILSIFIALGNLVGLLIYRSRRQYRVLSYKPHFTSPLESHFPARRGGRSPYQKLYEECSVPTPVHDKKIKIVTILENAFQKNNSKV